MKILANDGISKSGVDALEKNGFEVITTKVAQEQLINYINENQIDGLLVRSATQVRKELIDACPSLKLIGRGGVGMDNIDVAYAKEKGLHVINTPAASSESVAELVFAHLYGGVRFLYDANRSMPLEGDSRFKDLKKAYAGGMELRGKTLGIIGIGRIGQATARIALGVGMKVVAYDPFIEKADIKVDFYDGQSVNFPIETISKEEVLKQADFITVHVPAQKEYVIGKPELDSMKNGVGIVNAARGGVLDEVALLDALESGKIAFAGLDVFENEPKPAMKVLMHPQVSLTPHIGAATSEAQDRIGTELATQISELLK
ncbi:D-3-phosphoglycerate dehydrogenase [Zhouia amylolytica]|uniref:Phosphoglycerate dehydrogenase-like oxidoreductase n=2 Tax=Zhouia amylolytica TaxID=376730 RepID=W2UPK7_9FLAO|nr:D-2-hydroxyacid dehydrogenase [Zhouia amylolytica]ETN95416.1 phosphoglycerate dehydrogenase-like oxidoreductase [Zhouia amylolytica AD3]MCQ0112734.1 D-2-hydroxyacid dehydrogenase [Zhouia amylolytica]SFT01503.1 D-3-phosphoglycerate dehydrogenase [Zhouia amylolytica]